MSTERKPMFTEPKQKSLRSLKREKRMESPLLAASMASMKPVIINGRISSKKWVMPVYNTV